MRANIFIRPAFPASTIFPNVERIVGFKGATLDAIVFVGALSASALHMRCRLLPRTLVVSVLPWEIHGRTARSLSLVSTEYPRGEVAAQPTERAANKRPSRLRVDGCRSGLAAMRC